MNVRDEYPAIAILHDAWLTSGRKCPEAVRAFLELERIHALLPPCPTCAGEGSHGMVWTGAYTATGAQLYEQCPDCTDGKVSVEWLAAVFTETRTSPISDYSRLRDIRR
jgi:hypothetical protein